MKRRQFLDHVAAATIAATFIPVIHASAATTSVPAARYDRATLASRRTVRWSDGRTTPPGFLERPQLLIENGVPTHLFCATTEGPGVDLKDATRSWNVVFPLASLDWSRAHESGIDLSRLLDAPANFGYHPGVEIGHIIH